MIKNIPNTLSGNIICPCCRRNFNRWGTRHLSSTVPTPEEPTPGHAAAACNNTGAHLAIEFHFNSADSPSATGTETLYWESSPKGKLAATLVNDAMVSVLELKNRGLKPVNRQSARAVSYFTKTRMPAVLVEPAFAASNPEDNERLQNRIRELCVEVARAINEWKP